MRKGPHVQKGLTLLHMGMRHKNNRCKKEKPGRLGDMSVREAADNLPVPEENRRSWSDQSVSYITDTC